MTAPRQERKGWCPGNALITLFAGLFVLIGLSFAVHAAVTERVVLNRFSGLAIDGFDPVAYFTDGKPELGLEEFEASEAGVVWRFRNEGNRASFVAHPEIYGPQFGGYDPVDMARGVAVAGDPYFWQISGQRLYLFNREESRDAFARNPANIVQRANLRWPQVRHGLAQ
jgi:hypothetical protein